MFFFKKDNSNVYVKPGSVEHAYLALLNDSLSDAGVIFSKIDSPRAKWGKALIDIINGYIEIYPSYFEIRNFIEIDLDFLIKNNKIDYVEQVLGSLDYLSEINQEVYKFVGRVMFENRIYSAAKCYFDKSKANFYNDPELHYLLTRYYIMQKDYKNAIESVQECIRILPDYYPALELKKQLESYVAD